jgi:hypothetical protein
MEEVMLDSNLFDEVVDGRITLSSIQDHEATFYATPIQREELKNAGGTRAKNLLSVFNDVTDKQEDSIFAFDTEGAGFDQGAWASETQGKVYDTIQEEHAPGESEDVNMSAVAINEGITFVTADGRLQNALERTYPNSYLTKEEFVTKLNNESSATE